MLFRTWVDQQLGSAALYGAFAAFSPFAIRGGRKRPGKCQVGGEICWRNFGSGVFFSTSYCSFGAGSARWLRGARPLIKTLRKGQRHRAFGTQRFACGAMAFGVRACPRASWALAGLRGGCVSLLSECLLRAKLQRAKSRGGRLDTDRAGPCAACRSARVKHLRIA